jgi:hypothetical protein
MGRQALANPRVSLLAPEADVALAAVLLNDSFPGDPGPLPEALRACALFRRDDLMATLALLA